MSLSRKEKLLQQSYIKASSSIRSASNRKRAKQRLKLLQGGYQGTSSEFQEVVDYWKPYGIKPKKYWYQMYSDGRGKFDPRYIPDTMWFGTIIPYFNDYMLGRAYSDKCAYDLLFPHLHRPRTIAKNSCGRFYGSEQNVISREEAMALCLEENSFIIKSAMFSSGGRSIQIHNGEQINPDSVEKLFLDYRMNFLVQELVKQHPDLAILNPTSLNTMRIMTFFME